MRVHCYPICECTISISRQRHEYVYAESVEQMDEDRTDDPDVTRFEMYTGMNTGYF